MPTFHNILQTQTYLQPLKNPGNTIEEHAKFFLKLLINQRLSFRFFMFLPSVSSKTKPIFFSTIPVYYMPDPGENLQETLLIA